MINLKDTDEAILSFIYKIGHQMLSKIIENIPEPTVENRLIVDDKIAVYKDMQNRRFKNRFGDIIIRSRKNLIFQLVVD